MVYVKKHPRSIFFHVWVAILKISIAFSAIAAHAEEAAKDQMFSIGGFGTVGAVHSSSSDGDYVGSRFQTAGAGYTRAWDFGVDSKLGVQLNAQFTDKLLGIVQVVAQDRTNNTFGPRIEWANLQYALTDDLKIRVGRTALPLFMISDSRLVNYANPWVRPPLETYLINPITSSDGIDISYKMHFKDITNTIQAFDGSNSVDIVGSNGAIIRGAVGNNLRGINDTIEYGALTARAGLTRVNINFNLLPGVDLFPHPQYLNLGFIYDPGTWFLQGEYTRQTSDIFFTDQRSEYLTFGYRIKNFTPYATYAQVQPDGAPGFVSYDQKTSSLGMRWDFMKNVAAKFQWDRVSLGKGNTGDFVNVQPSLAGSTVNVVSVTVDFVF